MKKESIYAAIITFVFLSLGFTLLHYELIGYGFSFFVFLPCAIGYILGRSLIKKISLAGLIFSLVAFVVLLYFGALEGMICIFMSLPIIVVCIILGMAIKRFVDAKNKSREEDQPLKSTLVPVAIFLVLAFTETAMTEGNKSVVEVRSEIILPHNTMKVYDAIKSVDTLVAEKQFLMNLDLPVPQKCVLHEEKVGGLRTCYFEGGQIVEKITELEKGKVMRMDVIDYQLTGRKWLGFKEAIYLFDELENGHTRLTRITTYTSELYPRFYWEPLERWGIVEEHEYVFRDLKNDLGR